MRRRLRAALCALAATVCSGAWAGPPFLTDDPEPVAYRHHEFYVFSTYDHGDDGIELQAPAFEYNYGPVPDVQLHVGGALASAMPDAADRASGIGDLELGVKYRFVRETDARPQIAFYPLLELPTGDADRGLGNGRVWARLPIWIQKSWGPWTTYGGGGWELNRASGKRSHPFGGWLAQRDLGESLTLGGEIHAQGPDTDGARGATIVNLGGIGKVSPHFDVLFSVGRTIGGERHTVAYLGLYWTWGKS